MASGFLGESVQNLHGFANADTGSGGRTFNFGQECDRRTVIALPCAAHGTRFHPSNQPIVLGVPANPVPDHTTLSHDRQSSIIEPNANRVDVFFAFQFLELQAGMRRIGAEQPVGLLGVTLHFQGKAGKQTLEPMGGRFKAANVF